jgi:hypothetical protein
MNNPIAAKLGPFSLRYAPRTTRYLEKYAIQFAYGHREILLDYMGVNRSNILLGILQHGVSQEGLTPDTEFTRINFAPRQGIFGRAPQWVYSGITRNHLLANGVKNVEAIGAPWNYLEHNNFQQEEKRASNTNSRFIVFPQHLNASIKEEVPPDNLRKRIAYWRNLSNEQELTICIFWSEFLHPVWQEVCKEEGVKLVTAGIGDTNPAWSPHLSRVDFLHNLSSIMQKNTHCIFERETTGIFYAISLGLTVGYFPSTRPFLENESIRRHDLLLEKFPEVLNQFVSAEILMERSDIWLGRENTRTPEELKSILKFEEFDFEN